MLHHSFIPCIHPDESPASACSRVAITIGRTARDFCADMGFSFAGIVEGRSSDLDALARVCRLDRGFPGLSVIGTGHWFQIRGNSFTRDTLSRSRMRVCPHCLADDIAVGSGSMEARPYGRTVWLLESIRSCPRHRCPLVLASEDGRPHKLHDFAHLLAEAGGRPAVEDAPIGSRLTSRLEGHLLDRFGGTLRRDGWLAQFPAYAACRISETIGAVAKFGVRFASEKLTDDDWHRAGDIGFGIADAGKVGIIPFLDRLRRGFDDSRRAWGGRQVFGRLYEWLAHESKDPEYEPLRDVIRQYAVQNLPIGPGEEFLGEPVAHRCKHSIHSLHRETGTHPKRLRKLLKEFGVISENADCQSDERVVFDADVVSPMLDKVSGTLTLRGAATYLNAPRPHERILFETELVRPVVVGSKRGHLKHAFSIIDLDRFLERLLQDAGPATRSDSATFPIPSAAKRANCSAGDVVRLLLGRRLKTVRVDPAERGYLSVLVDPVEVLPHVRSAEHGGVALREVSRRLGTNDLVVKALTQHGLLPSRRAVNPVNHCPQTVVDEADIDSFSKRFVSLMGLSKEVGLHFRAVGKKLAVAGVVPTFEPQTVGAQFFEREACRRAFPIGDEVRAGIAEA